MTKICIDWPVAYTDLGDLYGDITFALGPLYRQNQVYREALHSLKDKEREILLDNGAWEFGETMNINDYIQLIRDLQPTYAVIPDVMMDMNKTIRTASKFLDNIKKQNLEAAEDLKKLSEKELQEVKKDAEKVLTSLEAELKSLQKSIETNKQKKVVVDETKIVNAVLSRIEKPRDGKDADGRDVASGVYVYRMESGVAAVGRKLVLIR